MHGRSWVCESDLPRCHFLYIGLKCSTTALCLPNVYKSFLYIGLTGVDLVAFPANIQESGSGHLHRIVCPADLLVYLQQKMTGVEDSFKH